MPRVASTSERTPWNLPLADLSDGIERSAKDLISLSGARILITGGTGFLGSWLVASLLTANRQLGLGMRLVVLTRDAQRAGLEPASDLSLVEGDVRSLPPVGAVDFVLHGAAASSAVYGEGDGDPRRMADTIVAGTRAVLDAAAVTHARVLFLSTGLVYGQQNESIAEDILTAPDTLEPRWAYGQAKRLAETLCAAAVEAGEVQAVVARLFAFVGPRIPLRAHFAVGNFLDDALAGRKIVVRSDGEARRSYLYTGDLPEWCWALLLRGRSGAAYNVGSPDAISIGELAHRAAALPPAPLEVSILGGPSIGAPSWYVPSTRRAESELGLQPRTPLDAALSKTFEWLKRQER